MNMQQLKAANPIERVAARYGHLTAFRCQLQDALSFP